MTGEPAALIVVGDSGRPTISAAAPTPARIGPAMMDAMSQLESAFVEADVVGFLHATDLGSGREVSVSADEPVVLASVFKIPVLVTLFRQVDAGELDPAEPVEVPAEGRTLGPFGLSVMRDPARLSWRDLAWLMMSLSDNTATDIVCDRVDVNRVNETMELLGLKRTVLIGDCQDIFDSIAADLGLEPGASLEGVDLTDPDVVRRVRAADPSATSRSTPREITTLLELIWRDEAATPESCAQMRRILGQQVWPHRLAAGFPEDDIATSGKTGTLPPWANEAGVVEFGDGGRYAVAVFTRSNRPAMKTTRADAAIARSARAAVDRLRG
jgi:beta-lactamase class A